ncbi:hypothetical protein E3V39_12400 [Gammaproteobacteria bacterium LSUCC0112]|nr:hypothetical protein E3V39_12400 [Gammaproteobacteria bacterium LSUCC0112]
MDGREDWERDFLNRLTYIRDIHDDQEDIYNREFHGTQNDVSQVIEFIKTLITTRDASVREEERQTTYNILADIIVGEAKRITELKEGGSKSAIERNMEGGIVQKMTEYIKELHHSLTPKADISKE